MPHKHRVKYSAVGKAARKRIGAGSGTAARVHAARATARAGGFNIGAYVSAAARGAHGGGVKFSAVGKPAGKGIGAGSASAKAKVSHPHAKALFSGGEISHGGNTVSFKNGIHAKSAQGNVSIVGNSVSVTRGGKTTTHELPINVGGIFGMARKLIGKYVG